MDKGNGECTVPDFLCHTQPVAKWYTEPSAKKLPWVIGHQYKTREGEVVTLSGRKDFDSEWPLIFSDTTRTEDGFCFRASGPTSLDIVEYLGLDGTGEVAEDELGLKPTLPTYSEATESFTPPGKITGVLEDELVLKLTLPTDSDERKEIPLEEGCYMYFPAALMGVARHSKFGNDKYNKGQQLHHSRGQSTDHGNCISRHKLDINDMLAHYRRTGQVDVKVLLAEANALAWRALALSQGLHEKFGGAPMAPNAWYD